ncbi:MAG: efflux RND transporter periplasmic adaptor subunit [Cyanobacteria bacterium J007]|nr:MAG: efflux RND transporter periplasmic adaptor subunit [Cyanobacteria bacterium J007]
MNHVRSWVARSPQTLLKVGSIAVLTIAALGVASCQATPEAGSTPGGRGNPERTENNQPIAVDIALAERQPLREPIQYTGTTRPVEEVSLRSRAEGQLLDLRADVGDFVTQGEILGRIDDTLAVADVVEAEAELAALQAEVQRLQAAVRDARSQVESIRLDLEQAENDAKRLQWLYEEGALSEQEAERARTLARTTRQDLEAARERIGTQEKAVEAAQKRVLAQEAVLAGLRSRRNYSVLTAPVSGSVVERLVDPGSFVQTGGEILKIADFSRLEVVVNLSELKLNQIRAGQTVNVRLDAFPEDSFFGEISRISPAANAETRQIPVEIILDNTDRRLASGLLARVSFEAGRTQSVVLPESALQTGETRARSLREGSEATVFAIVENEQSPRVEARPVVIGERVDGKVEIRAGLESGERVVVRSSKPLKDGDRVRPSILSE